MFLRQRALNMVVDFRAEVAIHEGLEDNEKKTGTSGGDENDENVENVEESSQEIFDLLKMVECCVAMMDGQFRGLDAVGRSRLSKNLLGLVLCQVFCFVSFCCCWPWSFRFLASTCNPQKGRVDCWIISASRSLRSFVAIQVLHCQTRFLRWRKQNIFL